MFMDVLCFLIVPWSVDSSVFSLVSLLLAIVHVLVEFGKQFVIFCSCTGIGLWCISHPFHGEGSIGDNWFLQLAWSTDISLIVCIVSIVDCI